MVERMPTQCALQFAELPHDSGFRVGGASSGRFVSANAVSDAMGPTTTFCFFTRHVEAAIAGAAAATGFCLFFEKRNGIFFLFFFGFKKRERRKKGKKQRRESER